MAGEFSVADEFGVADEFSVAYEFVWEFIAHPDAGLLDP